MAVDKMKIVNISSDCDASSCYLCCAAAVRRTVPWLQHWHVWCALDLVGKHESTFVVFLFLQMRRSLPIATTVGGWASSGRMGWWAGRGNEKDIPSWQGGRRSL